MWPSRGHHKEAKGPNDDESLTPFNRTILLSMKFILLKKKREIGAIDALHAHIRPSVNSPWPPRQQTKFKSVVSAMHTHVGSSQTINSRSFLPMAFLLVIHPSSMCRVIRTVISGSPPPPLFVFLCSSANPVGAGKVNRWTIGTNRTVDAENKFNIFFLGEQRQKRE